MDSLSSNGMDEAEFRGMKSLTDEAESLEDRTNRSWGTTIYRVSQ